MPLLVEKPYAYSPLGPDGIRFVILHPAIQLVDPLKITIFRTTLNRKTPYEALSYTWGDLTTLRSIAIHNTRSQRPQKLSVTENLESALRHLRYLRRSRLLWIDALSINQGDLEERSTQVTRMGRIFSRAKNVCIWLGPAAEGSDGAMEFVEQVTHLGKLDQLVSDSNAIKDWKALAALMRRPWFSRRWIIQEIAFARQATIHCGTKQTSWPDFADAVALYGEKFDAISNLVGPSGTKELRDDVCKGVAAHALVTVLNCTIRKAVDGGVVEKICTMDTLMANVATFQVTNPRDAVYAIITLVKDVRLPIEVPVDYNKSVAQICKDLIHHTILEDGCLDIICRPWAPVSPDLPSWIPQVSGHAYSADAKGYYRRINADSLVGRPKRSIYSASWTTHAMGHFSDEGRGFTLIVKGVEIETIISLEDATWDGIIPGRWIEVLMEIAERRGEESYGVDDKPSGFIPEWSYIPDLFWRTLVADRGPDGNAPPGWYRRACEEIYKNTDGGDHCDWDTTSMIEDPLEDGFSSTISAFFQRVQAVTWNRRPAVTQNQSVGIVPTDTQLGDKVCILFGCSVPVILRDCGDGTQGFIGECYLNSVEGVMDGLDSIKEGRYDLKDLYLK